MNVEELPLKRLDKKLWQYRHCTPTRVELAVLDVYKNHGWRGYFTEHFNFDETLIFMMCWPDHRRIGSTKYLGISDVHLLFHRARDGFIQDEKQVNFSRSDLINNAKEFQEADIPKILELWQSKPRFKEEFIGKAYLKSRHASELCADDLTSYYKAIGGKEHYSEYLEKRFPENLQILSSRARALTEEVRSRSDLGQTPNLMDSCMSFWHITNAARKPVGKYMSDAALDRFSKATLKKSPHDLAHKIVALAHEIIEARRLHEKAFPPPKATLDLRLWRNGQLADVEVKAPNDRLAPHQLAQFEQNKQSGRNSWLVKVFEN